MKLILFNDIYEMAFVLKMKYTKNTQSREAENIRFFCSSYYSFKKNVTTLEILWDRNVSFSTQKDMPLKKGSTYLSSTLSELIFFSPVKRKNETKRANRRSFILTRRQTTDCFRILYIDIAGIREAITRQIAS